ncbi:3447_t:CDS:2 [Entrophospora sp. SA101]|nr:3447_t:CDS:2 [Entrophospora sp. SA101]
MENHEINDTTAENNDTTIVTTDFDGNNKRVFGNIRRNLLSDGDSAIERKSLKLFDQLLKTVIILRCTINFGYTKYILMIDNIYINGPDNIGEFVWDEAYNDLEIKMAPQLIVITVKAHYSGLIIIN